MCNCWRMLEDHCCQLGPGPLHQGSFSTLQRGCPQPSSLSQPGSGMTNPQLLGITTWCHHQGACKDSPACKGGAATAFPEIVPPWLVWFGDVFDTTPLLPAASPSTDRASENLAANQCTSPTTTTKLVTAGKTAWGRARKLLTHQKIKTHCLDKRSGIILNFKQW